MGAIPKFLQLVTTLYGNRMGFNYQGDLVANGKLMQASLGLDTAATAAAATFNTTAIQAALTAGGLVQITTPGTYYVSDTLFLESNLSLLLATGVTLKSQGTTRFLMFTTQNCCWSSTVLAGVALIAASDGTTVGTGTIRKSTGPATLFYTAPGSTEGAGVDVSGAASGAARFTLTSGNGKQLHVAVVVAALPAASSATVRIGPNVGAKSITWSRTTNVTTVTESGHTRQPGDAVVLFGTNIAANVYVETCTMGTSWTFTDTRSNSSGSGEAFGKTNIRISGTGTIDYNMAAGTARRSVQDANTIAMFGVSHWRITDVLLYDGYKYGVMGQCVTDYDIDVRGYADNATSSTAIVQINGKSRHGRIRTAGRSTDTAMALIGGDYPTQTLCFSNDEGGLDFDDTEIMGSDGTDSNFEGLRLAGAANLWFRNTRVYNIRHNVRSGTTKIVSTSVDSNIYLGTEMNVEGLLIDGVFPSKAGTTECAMVSLQAAGSTKSSGVVIRRVELAYPLESQFSGPIEIVAGNWRDITVENCYQRSATWQGNLVWTSGSTASTIDNLTIRNNHLRIDNALKTTSWKSSLFSPANANMTIERLIIENGSLIEVSSGGTKSDVVILGNGTIKQAILQGLKADGCTGLLYYNSTDTGCKIIARDLEIASSFCLRFDTPAAEVAVGSVQVISGTLTDVVRIGYSSATMKVRSLGGMPATPSSGNHVNVAAGTSNSPDVNGADIICDISVTASAAGAMVINSAAATVPGTGLVQYDGAAWRRVAAKTQALTPGAAPAVNCNLGNNITLNTGANATVTLGAPSNVPAAGECVIFTITQDGVGGRVVAWNAAYIFSGGAFSNVGNTANKKTTINFISDGTALVANGLNTWY